MSLKCSSLLSLQPNPKKMYQFCSIFWFSCYCITESSEIPTNFLPTSAIRTFFIHCVISIVSHYDNCIHSFNPFCLPFFSTIHFHSQFVFFSFHFLMKYLLAYFENRQIIFSVWKLVLAHRFGWRKIFLGRKCEKVYHSKWDYQADSLIIDQVKLDFFAAQH